MGFSRHGADDEVDGDEQRVAHAARLHRAVEGALQQLLAENAPVIAEPDELLRLDAPAPQTHPEAEEDGPDIEEEQKRERRQDVEETGVTRPSAPNDTRGTAIPDTRAWL